MENENGANAGSTSAGRFSFFRGRFLSPFLFLVMMGFSVTTGILGYQLGKNGSGSSGELLDTIVLSSKGVNEVAHFLSGRLQREGEASPKGLEARLQGTQRSCKTDDRGSFYFSRVGSGSYILEVLEGENSLGTTPFSLYFTGDEIRIEQTEDGEMIFYLPEDVRLFEIAFFLSEDGTLEIQLENCYFVTADGEMTDLEGVSVSTGDGVTAVTPSGNIAAGDRVILPGPQVVIYHDEEVPLAAFADEDGEIETGEDGSVTVGGDTTVTPDGDVVPPEDPDGGEEPPVVVEDGEVTPFADAAKPSVPTVFNVPYRRPVAPAPTWAPASTETPGESSGPEVSGGESSGSTSSGGTSSGEGSSSQPGGEGESSGMPEVTPTPTPTPKGMEIWDKESMISWEQQSAIDLFRRRTDGLNLGEEDGKPLIAPGSSGYYDFKLKNPDEFDIYFRVKAEELSFHLPILYSVKNLETGEYYLFQSKTGYEGKAAGAISTSNVKLPAGQEMCCRLEWEWQYEDWYVPEKDDAIDTSAAQAEDRTYLLALHIFAEQIDPDKVDHPDGDTKYPGKR